MAKKKLDSPVMEIQLKEGPGGVDALSITMILPDTEKPSTHALICTESFPSGLRVVGTSADYNSKWWKIMGKYMGGE